MLRPKNYLKKVLGLNNYRKLADIITEHGGRHSESLGKLERHIAGIGEALTSVSRQITALQEAQQTEKEQYGKEIEERRRQQQLLEERCASLPPEIVRELLCTSHELRVDVARMAELLAALESARYYTDRMSRVPNFPSDLALLENAFGLCRLEGLILEFGVASGRTIHKLASLTNRPIYGFDVFSGLPETWRTGFPAGTFQQDALPKMPPHVVLIPGLFEDTLPAFAAAHQEQAAFIHVDCDLYSSARTILANLGSHIAKGTIIVFDEYFNYPGWQQHEYRALKEFISASGYAYEYIGFVSSHQQVAVRITSSEPDRHRSNAL